MGRVEDRLNHLKKGTGYFSNDHLCIALGRDTEFKKSKGTGGLDGLARCPCESAGYYPFFR